MSDNIDDILKLKSADQAATPSADVTPNAISSFAASGFVTFSNVLGWFMIACGILCILPYSSFHVSLVLAPQCLYSFPPM
jgi:hypothetical protein